MDLIKLGAFAAHLAVAIFLGSLPGIAPDKIRLSWANLSSS